MIGLLLEYGADVNAVDSDRRTALHHAAEGNKMKVIDILVQNGAHTSIKDAILGKTPLEMAANDLVRERILANLRPEYQQVEFQNKQEMMRGKLIDTQVNKKG